MVNCENKQWCTKECEQCQYYGQQEAIQTICAAYAYLARTVGEWIETTLDLLLDAIIQTYPNKRVVYLALYHPKERIRKKNRQRIFKWFNKIKDGEDNG